MCSVAEGQYLSAGYYLARPAERGAHTSATLIPAKLISASSCICEFFPDSWAIKWSSEHPNEREESASAFRIQPHEIDAVIQWATNAFEKEFGWPNVFYSLEAAFAGRSKILASDVDVAVFGLGLNREYSEEFLRYAKPPEQTPGYAPQGETGIYECVNAQRQISPGGRQIGFELLAVFLGLLTCSWLCNSLETVFEETLGVRPNKYGFIADYSDAKRCTDYISRGEVGAEPGLWLPWLITLYSEK